MPAIVLTLLQGLFLLLLYIFVGRAVRAVVRDLRTAPATGRTGPRPARGPAPERRRSARSSPREIVVHKPDGKPRVLTLDHGELIFGRAETAAVVLSDPYVSDHHARIYRDGDDWMVADLGSTNGTFLNQHKVGAPTALSAGDQLGIGRTVVEVRR
ncbi:MAG: FHA domain-containing protein FhaB/FipA [Egibacteraceae bacterium]